MSVTEKVNVTRNTAQHDVTLLNYSKLEEFLESKTYSVVGVSADYVPLPLHDRLKELSRSYKGHNLRVAYMHVGSEMSSLMSLNYDVRSLPAIMIFDGVQRRGTIHTPQAGETHDGSTPYYGPLSLLDKELFLDQFSNITRKVLGEKMLAPIAKSA